MGRLFRRIALLAVLGGIAAAIGQRFMRRDECTPTCQCSLGAASCDCGHVTCLAPVAA